MSTGCSPHVNRYCPVHGACECSTVGKIACPLHKPTSYHGSERKEITGCPIKGCEYPGWWSSTNDVPYGDTTVCESGEGWCWEHGHYREAFHVEGNHVEFDDDPLRDDGMTIEQKAQYTGLSVQAFKAMVKEQ